MIRYIALIWDDDRADRRETASQLDQALRGAAGWCAAVDQPGLRIHVDNDSHSNGLYHLGARHGLILGRAFRRSALLGAEPATPPSASDLADAVRTSGRSLITTIWGRYIAFIADRAGSVTVLRDPSGTLPCFLVRHLGLTIVFSNLEDTLHALPALPTPTIDWDGVRAYLLGGSIGGRSTALSEVERVLPGEALKLQGDGILSERCWQPVQIATRPTPHSSIDAQAILRQTVLGCNRAWAGCYDSVVLRLSGGVDSSILAGALSRKNVSTRVTCLNYFHPNTQADERPFARLAAARAERELIEIEPEANVSMDRLLTASFGPVPRTFMGRLTTSHLDAAVCAEQGAHALFTGAGGDQAFYELRRWWPAADYLHVRGLDRGFPTALMDAARLGRLSVWKTAALAFRERLFPSGTVEHLGRHRKLVDQAALPTPSAHGRFADPLLHGRIDLPIGKLRQMQNLMIQYDYYDPLEGRSAPELVNPLLSQPVVELALSLPVYQLTEGGRGRALARSAFASMLPAEVLARRSKGGIDNHVRQTLMHNHDFVRTMLMDGQLLRRGFLLRDRVEEVVSGRSTASSVPVSEVHILVGIEAWLARWTKRVDRVPDVG